ncbi:hypothetical protein PHYPSEUDO_014225 [Phytophthora pseudosyringae]|uniref:Uncharacterized protein n=1 Tax=Phytophthora pseudosyringae TaxID=221518 RepID=A0A8T1WJS2_9STRA|nr:hypothetical protein PHYPSEUDO_014225 [Phytophthora pseudosyringae]
MYVGHPIEEDRNIEWNGRLKGHADIRGGHAELDPGAGCGDDQDVYSESVDHDDSVGGGGGLDAHYPKLGNDALVVHLTTSADTGLSVADGQASLEETTNMSKGYKLLELQSDAE